MKNVVFRSTETIKFQRFCIIFAISLLPLHTSQGVHPEFDLKLGVTMYVHDILLDSLFNVPLDF